MRGSRWLVFVMLCMAGGVHATSSVTMGAITFQGVITRDTSPPSLDGNADATNLAQITSVLSLDRARAMLASDLLNFFVGYARPDTRLISVTYK